MFKKLLLLSTFVTLSLANCSQQNNALSTNQNIMEYDSDGSYDDEDTEDDESSINQKVNTSKLVNNKSEEFKNNSDNNKQLNNNKSNDNNSRVIVNNNNKNNQLSKDKINNNDIEKSSNNSKNNRSDKMKSKNDLNKKGIKNMKNNFDRKLFEDAENLDLSNDADRKKLEKEIIDTKAEKSNFPNDLWIINRDSNSVNFEIRFRNEGKRSFYENPMLLGLTVNTIIEGTKTKTGKEIKELIDNKSISIAIHEDYDDIILTVGCLSKYFNDVIDLLCDLLTNSIFPEDKIKVSKEAIILELEQSKFIPQSLAREKFNQLYLDKKYHIDIDKAISKTKQYTKKDIFNCYNKLFNPENAVITIVGNIKNLDKQNNTLNKEEIEDKNNKAKENSNASVKENKEKIINNSILKTENVINGFNKLHKVLLEKVKKHSNGKNHFVSEKQTTELKKYESTHVTLNNPQSVVMFALPGVLQTDKDKVAIRAANYILGRNSLNSRLYQSVREKAGLVYYISSGFSDLDLQSVLIGIALTRPENTNKVIDEIKKQIALLHDNGISEKELKDFKVEKYASYSFTTNIALLYFVACLRKDGIKIEEINKYLSKQLDLTLDDINKSLKKVFNPKKLVFLTCGMDKEVIDAVQKSIEKNQNSNTEVIEKTNQLQNNKKEIKQTNNKKEINQINIQERVLKNGLRVIVAPLNTKNSVCFGVGYLVGCADDPRNVRGISHFLEHMMFKQTSNLKLGEVSQYLNKYSTYNNAFTWYDFTFYMSMCKKAFLELFLQMEADRMVNAQFDPKEVDKERNAVIEERKRGYESYPDRKYIWEAALKSLYLYSTYSDPSIGYMDQINSYTAEALKKHYDKYYIPNNAIVLFVGDINIDEAEKLCEKYFGDIEKGPEITRNIPVDPEDTGIISKLTHKSDQLAAETIQIFYKIPKEKIDTIRKQLTINIVINILTGGMSSVIYKKLVEDKKMLHDVSSEIWKLKHDTSLSFIGAKLQEGIDIRKVEEEINKLIEEFKNTILTKELFEKEKQKYSDNFDLMLDNQQKLNWFLIEQILSGYSIDEIKNVKNILNEITYEDVKAVANDIFDIKNQKLVVYQMPDKNKKKNKLEEAKQFLGEKTSKVTENVKQLVKAKNSKEKSSVKQLVEEKTNKVKSNVKQFMEGTADKVKEDLNKVKNKINEKIKNKEKKKINKTKEIDEVN